MEILVMTEQQPHRIYTDAAPNNMVGMKFLVDKAVVRLIDNAAGSALTEKHIDGLKRQLRAGLRKMGVVEFPLVNVTFTMSVAELHLCDK